MKTYLTEGNLLNVGAGSNLDCKLLTTQAQGTEVDPQHPLKIWVWWRVVSISALKRWEEKNDPWVLLTS